MQGFLAKHGPTLHQQESEFYFDDLNQDNYTSNRLENSNLGGNNGHMLMSNGINPYNQSTQGSNQAKQQNKNH